MSDKSPENSPKTLKSYASRVFQESSVGVVSSLAHTESKKRRIFKVIAFILCLTGFLYQSGKFLEMVLQYPTSVGIEIKRPSSLRVPGFTFCDNNGVNRKLFCDRFPERCEISSEELCSKYFDYCGENKTLVPLRKHYSFHDMENLSDMVEFNVKLEDFVQITRYYNVEEEVTGPYRRQRDIDQPEFLSMCYSFYERVNNSLPLPEVEPSNIMRRPVNSFKFRVAGEETFLPGSQSGILFAVHSPFESANPFEVGIFMRPGRSYMIFVNIEEEVMLERPYDTNCVNYTELWEKNGRTGARSQDTCERMCMEEITTRCMNCILPFFMIERNESVCRGGEDENCSSKDFEGVARCFEKCGDDCMRTKFSYTVQERFIPHFTSDGEEIQDLDSTIKVDVYIEADEIVVLKYSPKYMFVEVFSNIGGFIGCWLGINLLDITDILDGFFRITRYSFKKRR